MINQDIKDSKAYKTYYDFSTGKVSPKKARKFKKIASPLRKVSPIKEAEHVKKDKRVKRPAKKSAIVPTAGDVIRDTLGVLVSKKKAPAKGDRGKGIEFLFDFALLEAKSKKDSHMLHASGSGDVVGFQLKVPNESEDKTTGTDKGTGTKPGVLNVPSYESDSDNESWRDSEDASDDTNDDDDDDDNINDDDSEMKMMMNTESSRQSTPVSSNFISKFLISDNIPPVVDEVAFMMNVKNHEEESSTQAPSFFTVPKTTILEASTTHATTVPLTVSMITPLPQLTTPFPAPITVPTTTSILALPDFSSLLDLIKESLPWKQSSQEERKLYIDVVEKSVKDIIKDEVKSLLPQILPKEVSDFATPSLTEFELKKILLDKMERNESFKTTPEHKELYEGLVKSYNPDTDLFSSYGKAYSLKRDHEDKDKDEDPSAGSDQGLKKQKTSKDVEPPKGSKSKESKTSSSKGTKSQPKSSGKFVKAEDPV
nr:hypothetical protein [Tanacetum cinerariifolium]